MAVEYIKKEDVLNLNVGMWISEGLSSTEAANMAIKNFKEFVKQISPVDVVERKSGHRGHWGAYDFHTVECSVCEFRIDIMKTGDHVLTHLNFCPNCGADMRGEDDV